MKIETVELIQVSLPLLRPFRTSSSVKTHIEHILVRAEADGFVGWGETASPADPYYCPETVETCWHILKDFLAPSVLGKEWGSIEALRRLYGTVKGNNFAKSGLEMAAWDIVAQREGKPMHQLLGGSRPAILSGVSLGIEDKIENLLALIEKYVGEGYRRVKLKIGPGKDVDVIREVRKHFPDTPLMADANSAYTLADIPMLKALDEFGLTMIEQPLSHDDIIDHAQLQRAIETPVCLDESIHSAEDARKAIDLGSCRVINIKVSRVGGLAEARHVHDVCAERGVPVWCGGMHEFGIGRAANIAIASLPNFSIPGDISGSDKYYAEDLVDPVIIAPNGAIAVPQSAGLGYAVNEGRVRRNASRSLTLRAG